MISENKGWNLHKQNGAWNILNVQKAQTYILREHILMKRFENTFYCLCSIHVDVGSGRSSETQGTCTLNTPFEHKTFYLSLGIQGCRLNSNKK